MEFKPMLAATVEPHKLDLLTYPVLGSPKLDGVRCMVHGDRLVSRNFKLIQNKHVQNLFGRAKLDGIDGELIYGDPTDPDVFKRTESAVMSVKGEPNVNFHAFDKFSAETFEVRYARVQKIKFPGLIVVAQMLLQNERELRAYGAKNLELGYEGTMIRRLDGLYKEGRSTLYQQYLVKYKQFEDAEAEVIGTERLQHNQNEAKINELGYKERSTKKAGMVESDKMGALVCRGLNGKYKGKVFNVGSGFTDAQRRQEWLNGTVIKYKFFPGGNYELPRFATFLNVLNKDLL